MRFVGGKIFTDTQWEAMSPEERKRIVDQAKRRMSGGKLKTQTLPKKLTRLPRQVPAPGSLAKPTALFLGEGASNNYMLSPRAAEAPHWSSIVKPLATISGHLLAAKFPSYANAIHGFFYCVGSAPKVYKCFSDGKLDAGEMIDLASIGVGAVKRFGGDSLEMSETFQAVDSVVGVAAVTRKTLKQWDEAGSSAHSPTSFHLLPSGQPYMLRDPQLVGLSDAYNIVSAEVSAANPVAGATLGLAKFLADSLDAPRYPEPSWQTTSASSWLTDREMEEEDETDENAVAAPA